MCVYACGVACCDSGVVCCFVWIQLLLPYRDNTCQGYWPMPTYGTIEDMRHMVGPWLHHAKAITGTTVVTKGHSHPVAPSLDFTTMKSWWSLDEITVQFTMADNAHSRDKYAVLEFGNRTYLVNTALQSWSRALKYLQDIMHVDSVEKGALTTQFMKYHDAGHADLDRLYHGHESFRFAVYQTDSVCTGLSFVQDCMGFV